MGAWQAAAFFVMSVSAYYLLKKKHVEFAKRSIQIAIIVAVVASILQLVTGHSSADTLAETQPAKLAAFEGVWAESEPAGLYLLGWVNDEAETTYGIEIPGMLSYLLHGDTETPIRGLKSFPPEDRPPVNIIFQSYHLMVGIGMALILISLLTLLAWWRGMLEKSRWLLWILVFSVLLPQFANQLGWFSAEVGRQPWIVYGLLRTKDAISVSVGAGQVLASIVLFALIYLLLFVLFIYLLNEKIQTGPKEIPETDALLEGPRA
jgi:cytochrome d ubiquinol oxidase subunit I